MTIRQFDTELGLYAFEEYGIVTEPHTHPVLELVVALDRPFDLYIADQALKNIRIGIVAPNVIHAINAQNSTLEIIMVEPGHLTFSSIGQTYGTTDAAQLAYTLNQEIKEDIGAGFAQQWIGQFSTAQQYDPRVIDFIRLVHEDLEEDKAPALLKTRAQMVFLSEGRLSHLFKSQLGISVQQYLVWVRIKYAIKHLLTHQTNLRKAAIAAGFYDMAHFTKHFKHRMGISPSLVYNNSRIVQL